MLQNTIDIERSHHLFVETICKTQIIYGLKDKNGYAMSTSNNYETTQGEAIGLICLWSEEVQARVLAKEEWSDYKVQEISLNSFLENWCIGMHFDGLYVGTNFNQNLFGFEIEPLELGMEIINEIKKHNYKIPLLTYKNLKEVEKALNEAQKG